MKLCNSSGTEKKATTSAAPPSLGSCCVNPLTNSLVSLIDFERSEAKNFSHGASVEPLFSSALSQNSSTGQVSRYKSDADADLLLNIKFTQAVNVHGFAITAPSTTADNEEDIFAPNVVHLYAGKMISFLETDSQRAQFSSPLSSTHLQNGTPTVNMKLKKKEFSGITQMTMYFPMQAYLEDDEDADEDDAETFLSHIQLFGVSADSTNMKELKKVG